MKLGIIGSGTIVQEFLPKLMNIEGIEIFGILGIKNDFEILKTLCEDNNLKLATTEYDDLCASGIDTVYVAVPNHLHYCYCKKSLEKGLNVIVEKPMASNFAQATELAELARKHNVFIFEAVTTLYLDNYKKIQEWLPRIGDVKLVQSQYTQYSRRYRAFKNGEILPAFDVNKAGGALMDLNLYNLHYVLGLFGKPIDSLYYANIEHQIDTSGCLMLKYQNFVAICIAGKDCKGAVGGIIQGTEGCIKSERSPNIVGRVTLELNDGSVDSYDSGSVKDRLIPEFKAFVQAINCQDIDFFECQLKKSLEVCEIQTDARRKAGIVFPFEN